VPGKRTSHIITFSGIDGAGKSTQIHALESRLIASGLRVSTLSFWNDVVVGQRWREIASRYAFRGDQGTGTPEKPLHRRDKNVTSWPLTFVRFCFYFADTVNLFFKVWRIEQEERKDVVIFDRYIYDELANLPLDSRWARVIVRLLLRLTAKPDAAFLIDVAPEAARARKPEYPLEFLHRNRQSYFALKGIIGDMIVIEGGPIAEMERSIRMKLPSRILQIEPDSLETLQSSETMQR
jgi:thymidylate kinase